MSSAAPAKAARVIIGCDLALFRVGFHPNSDAARLHTGANWLAARNALPEPVTVGAPLADI
jgi:hypothetical protein